MYTLSLATLDIAGTTMVDDNLVDSAFLRVFAAHEIAATAEELLPFRGSAKRPIVAAMVGKYRPAGGESLIDTVTAGFEDGLEAELRRRAAPIPGTEETFAWLRDRGIRVALTTGFSTRIKNAVLELFGWGPAVIDAAVCSSDVPESRPAPWMIFAAMEATGVHRPEAVLAAGDTPRDLQAGTNAGCGAVVGVLTGAGTTEALGRVRHTHILPSVAEIPELVEREYRVG